MSNSGYNPSDFTDGRRRQSTLDVGADANQTKHRESRIDTGSEFVDTRTDDDPSVSAQADMTGTVQWPSHAKRWLSTTDSSGDGIYLRLTKTDADSQRPYRLVFEDKDSDEKHPVGEALTEQAGEAVLERIETELSPTDFPTIYDDSAQSAVRQIVLDVNEDVTDTDGFDAFTADGDDDRDPGERPGPNGETGHLGYVSDDEDEPVDRTEDRVEITFERLDAANDWRDDHPDALGPSDTRRTKTVTLRADVDDRTRESAEDSAFVSQNTGKSYGQMTLTDAERDRLDDRSDWTWGTKGFHAMASKAVLVEEGADNWLDHYHPDLESIEHASVIESGKDDAARLGLAGPGETGEIDDSDVDLNDLARQHDKGLGEACQQARDYCEEGDTDACHHLQKECDYSDEDIDDVREAFNRVDEPHDFVLDPGVYDPMNGEMVEHVEADVPSQPFDEWATAHEPDAERPSDEELAQLAPTPTDDPAAMHEQLPGPALRALRKAWGGYRAARANERNAVEKAEHYAEIINGIRAVNGQDPLSFERLDGWAGGDPLPDDPTETFPGPDGEETIEEAVMKGRISSTVESPLSLLGDVYDPSIGENS
ncbi:hypothetical protein [Haladaptatus paucihalophilus]|uniref:Uncharacterized protein n=1 Tax=Haladaptatus paucihalophilus DX253 TaxID=797209 RepID=A0A1M7CML8_HALPU|nr:hypothetical protein [Haladaptatus paucihalophilus]SHL68363.1 hypothetical protein SAMN05444342_4403 [Haladaptatus paucihalophilus DX253]